MPDDVGRKIDTVLAEYRIMVPALGAIFGFQLVVAFQPSFAEMGHAPQYANFAGLVCTAASIMFLLVPASYHRFTSELDESPAFLTFAQRMGGMAFVFLPLSLALSIYVQAVRTFGDARAVIGVPIGVMVLLGYAWWYVPRRMAHRPGRRAP